MSKKLAIILIIAMFFLGSIIGHQLATRKYEKILQVSSENVASGYAKNSIYLLNLLRTNNSAKAIENLEMNLDWELLGLSFSMSNAPRSPLDPYFLKTIQNAKEYRVQFPHKSESPSLDEELLNIFLHVNAPTNK